VSITTDTEGVNATAWEGHDSLEDMYWNTHPNIRINPKPPARSVAIANFVILTSQCGGRKPLGTGPGGFDFVQLCQWNIYINFANDCLPVAHMEKELLSPPYPGGEDTRTHAE